MPGTFVSLRRIAALSVAITLVVAPIASAQTPTASPHDAPAGAVLLRPTAFARLVRPAVADVAPLPAVADPPRIDLLRQGRAAVARQAQAAPTKATQQKGWWARNKWNVIASAIVGVLVFSLVAGLSQSADE